MKSSVLDITTDKKETNQRNAIKNARQSVAHNFQAIDQLIIKSLHSRVPLVEQIGHYIVDAGGKRLRPLLHLLAANALNYPGQDHIHLAVIIEFIHTATLLHDDVVDESSLRRGRMTVNHQWGNSASILVGDFIYSRAFQLLTQLNRLEYMQVLADTTNTIAEGEVLQLQEKNNPDATEEIYMEIIRRKTAVLFSAAMELAALAANRADLKSAFINYGINLGIAFQLIDDLLDYTQDAAKTGKQLGDDLAEGKPTLPLIYALQRVNAEEREMIRQAITHGKSTDIEQILAIVNKTNVYRNIRALAKNYLDQALRALNELPASIFRDHLQQIALFTLARDH